MKETINGATIALTLIIYFMGHIIDLLIELSGRWFEIPPPETNPMWGRIWFFPIITFAFLSSLLFCRWFASRVENKIKIESTFE